MGLKKNIAESTPSFNGSVAGSKTSTKPSQASQTPTSNNPFGLPKQQPKETITLGNGSQSNIGYRKPGLAGAFEENIGGGYASPLQVAESEKLKQIQSVYSGNKKAITEAQVQPLGENGTVSQGFADADKKGNRATHIYNELLAGLGNVAAGAGDVGALVTGGMQADGTFNPYNSLETLKEYRETVAPQVREYLKENIGAEVDKSLENKYKNETITQALGGLAQTLPSIAATMASGGAGAASMFLQSYDSALQSLDQSEAGQNLDPLTKTIYATGIGTVSTLLEKAGLDRIMKGNTTIFSKLITDRAIAKATAETGGKITGDVLSRFLNREVLDLNSKFVRGGAKVLDSYLTEYATGASQEIANIAGGNLINYATGEPVFDTSKTNTWNGFIDRVNTAGNLEGLGGGLLGSVASLGGFKKADMEKRQATLNEINTALNDEAVSDVAKEVLIQQKIKLQDEIEAEGKVIDEAFKKLDTKQKEQVVNLVEQKAKIEEVMADEKVPDEVKNSLKEEVKVLDKELSEIKPVEEVKPEIKEVTPKEEVVVTEQVKPIDNEQIQDTTTVENVEETKPLSVEETKQVEKPKEIEIELKNGQKIKSTLDNVAIKPQGKNDFSGQNDFTNTFSIQVGDDIIGELFIRSGQDGNYVSGVDVFESDNKTNRRQGIGAEAYKKAAKYLWDNGKNILRSDNLEGRNNNSEAVWKSLEKQGLATKVEEGDNNYYVFNNQSTESTTSIKEDTKAGDPIRRFAEKVRSGKINKLGGFKTSTGFDGAWDLGIEAVALSLEGGAKVADAIQAGLKAIKQTDWYKKLEDKETFDEQYNSHMQAEYAVEEKKATAVKNKDIKAKRNELGLEERETVAVLKNTKLVEQADDMVKNGYDLQELIDKILVDKESATAQEIVILKKYQLAKEEELVSLGDKIVQAMEDGKGKTALDKLIADRDEVLSDIERAYEAGERSGTITARALQARKIALINDFSLANMLIQKRKANGGEKLTNEQVTATTAEYTKIAKLNEEYAKKIEELTEENKDLRAKNTMKSLKGIIELEKRNLGRLEKREAIDKDISDSWDSLGKKARSTMNNLSANPIPVELVPDLAKIAKLYAKKGINTIEGIADAMYVNLKNQIDGLTKENIEEVLVNYDYEAEAKNESRLKSFKGRTAKKINELRGRIDKQDFAKRKLEPISLDEEAIGLRDALRKAKYDWEYNLAKDEYSRRTKMEKARDIATEVLNTPRALMASLDFSAPLRQGLVLGIGNPKEAGRAFVEMFRQSWSQKRFDTYIADLKESPIFSVMDKAGLYISDPNKPKLSAKEEEFMTNFAEKIPVLGKMIKASERAYVGYLNKLRADVFIKTATLFENDGKTIETDPKLYEALAKYINAATGRGSLGEKANSLQLLNSLFFSPRLIASRIQLLLPFWLINTPQPVRLMYMKDMLSTIAVGTTILSLAALGGADVEEDPRSSDFGKIRIGDKRWDIWGGFQQFVRFFTQLATAQRKSTADGAIREIDGTGYNKENRDDLIINMIRSKMAPVPAMGWNLAAGETMIGEKYTYKDIPKSFIPLFASDLATATAKDGIKGFLGSSVGAFGVGVQDYSKSKKEKTENKSTTKNRNQTRERNRERN